MNSANDNVAGRTRSKSSRRGRGRSNNRGDRESSQSKKNKSKSIKRVENLGITEDLDVPLPGTHITKNEMADLCREIIEPLDLSQNCLGEGYIDARRTLQNISEVRAKIDASSFRAVVELSMSPFIKPKKGEFGYLGITMYKFLTALPAEVDLKEKLDEFPIEFLTQLCYTHEAVKELPSISNMPILPLEVANHLKTLRSETGPSRAYALCQTAGDGQLNFKEWYQNRTGMAEENTGGSSQNTLQQMESLYEADDEQNLDVESDEDHTDADPADTGQSPQPQPDTQPPSPTEPPTRSQGWIEPPAGRPNQGFINDGDSSETRSLTDLSSLGTTSNPQGQGNHGARRVKDQIDKRRAELSLSKADSKLAGLQAKTDKHKADLAALLQKGTKESSKNAAEYSRDRHEPTMNEILQSKEWIQILNENSQGGVTSIIEIVQELDEIMANELVNKVKEEGDNRVLDIKTSANFMAAVVEEFPLSAEDNLSPFRGLAARSLALIFKRYTAGVEYHEIMYTYLRGGDREDFIEFNLEKTDDPHIYLPKLLKELKEGAKEWDETEKLLRNASQISGAEGQKASNLVVNQKIVHTIIARQFGQSVGGIASAEALAKVRKLMDLMEQSRLAYSKSEDHSLQIASQVDLEVEKLKDLADQGGGNEFMKTLAEKITPIPGLMHDTLIKGITHYKGLLQEVEARRKGGAKGDQKGGQNNRTNKPADADAQADGDGTQQHLQQPPVMGTGSTGLDSNNNGFDKKSFFPHYFCIHGMIWNMDRESPFCRRNLLKVDEEFEKDNKPTDSQDCVNKKLRTCGGCRDVNNKAMYGYHKKDSTGYDEVTLENMRRLLNCACVHCGILIVGFVSNGQWCGMFVHHRTNTKVAGGNTPKNLKHLGTHCFASHDKKGVVERLVKRAVLHQKDGEGLPNFMNLKQAKKWESLARKHEGRRDSGKWPMIMNVDVDDMNKWYHCDLGNGGRNGPPLSTPNTLAWSPIGKELSASGQGQQYSGAAQLGAQQPTSYSYSGAAQLGAQQPASQGASGGHSSITDSDRLMQIVQAQASQIQRLEQMVMSGMAFGGPAGAQQSGQGHQPGQPLAPSQPPGLGMQYGQQQQLANVGHAGAAASSAPFNMQYGPYNQVNHQSQGGPPQPPQQPLQVQPAPSRQVRVAIPESQVTTLDEANAVLGEAQVNYQDGHNKKDSYSVNHVKQSLLQSMQHGGGANLKDAKFYVYEAGSGSANHSFSVKTVNDILFM